MPWQAEAIELKAQGRTVVSIAIIVGRSETHVRRFFYLMKDAAEHGPTLAAGRSTAGRDIGLFEARSGAARPYKQIIKRDAIGEATRLFAAGKISRATMMKRIWGADL